MTLTIRTYTNDTIDLPLTAVDVLTSSLRGRLVRPADEDYEAESRIWNAMIERRPALIVQCANAGDVLTAVRFARDNKLLVAVRGGGHNIAGYALCEGGLLIDLSKMRTVTVDAERKRTLVEPGATLADVDRETQAHRLALPTGINSTTGIAGLTLGGGFGWITRKFGLTIDNLLSADVVTANGEAVHASASENPELFWALRGGGGNFGVVTRFEFQLHALGPQVLSGLVVHPFADARSVLQEYRNLLLTAPDELTCWAVMRQAPPLPFLAQEWHGKEILILAICYCGDLAAGEAATAALRAIGRPVADVVSPHAFVDWQQGFDALLTPGARNYWKSHDLTQLSDAAIPPLLEAITTLPGPECEVFLGHVGGAAGRIAADATAYPQRRSHFVMNVHARWREPAMDAACIGWARRLFEGIKPHAAGTAYVNFLPEDEGDRVEVAYGPNFRRLADIKRRYDPHNLFRLNANVIPAVAARAA
jgi:FAD/FMN-containing dehydrogenase